MKKGTSNATKRMATPKTKTRSQRHRAARPQGNPGRKARTAGVRPGAGSKTAQARPASAKPGNRRRNAAHADTKVQAAPRRVRAVAKPAPRKRAPSAPRKAAAAVAKRDANGRFVAKARGYQKPSGLSTTAIASPWPDPATTPNTNDTIISEKELRDHRSNERKKDAAVVIFVLICIAVVITLAWSLAGS